MIEYGLKMAAAISFAVHIALIIATFITIGRTPSFQMPSPYTVRLVSPDESAVKALRVPPAKKHIPLAKEEPAAEEPSVKTVKAPPPKKTPSLEDYTDEKIAALRKQRERERDRAEKQRAIAAMRKRARVEELAEAKAAVTVTAKAVGEAGQPAEGSIVGDYVQNVRSLIEQEWILAGTGREGLYAIITVRVMKNGTLKVTDMERSSGDAIFDRSALRAISKASPVPPPPYEMELGVRFIPLNE
jgi:colicin import membrane protein